MTTFVRDLRYAMRTLGRAPAFGVTAIVTLALGIGASTAIFSVVNAVLLRPLPYAHSERLVLVWEDLRARNVTDFPFPPGDYADLRAQVQGFEDLAAVTTFRAAISADNSEPEQIRVAAVTTNFLPLIGVNATLGRNFQDSDGLPQPAQNPPAGGILGAVGAAAAAAPVVPPLPQMALLSDGFWRRRYGGDPGVVGRTIALGAGPVHVVGVLPPGVELLFPPETNIERAPDVWTALRIDYATASRNTVFMRVVGRLKPGVSVPQAQAQVDAVAAELRQRFPIKQTSNMHMRVEAMHDDLVADVRPAVLTLMGAVTFVLLIACANVANLLLVRMSGRTRELAVRAALGGSRWRLVRQTLVESLVLASGGALFGLGLAQLGIELLLLLRPDTLPRLDDVSIDPMVLAFTVSAAFAAALLFGTVPAWRASRPDVMDVLRASGRLSTLAGGRALRNTVVTLEVALAFVLLMGSGLMIRSFAALQRVNPGYEANGVLTFVLQLQGQRFAEAQQRAAFVTQVRQRLAALPGVTAVSAASTLPLAGGLAFGRWGPEDAAADPSKFQQATFRTVLPGYFEVLKTPLVDGRTFTDADNVETSMRVVVDRRLAQKAFPNGSAVGRHILARLGRSAEAERFEIIGVVDHQRSPSLAADGREAIFFIDGANGFGGATTWAVRTTGDPLQLGAAIRKEIHQLDGSLPVAEMQPMTAFVDRAMAPTRFALVLIGVFGSIAAVLAAIGLYGVLSTMVRQRTAEIGVRMAFGAEPTSIFRLMVGHGLVLGTVGIAIGVAAALGLTRFMQTMLVSVEPTDPLTFVAIAALFLSIAGLASWLPARRAARLDPTGALRDA